MIAGLVYTTFDGEKDASIAHDSRANLARALGWIRLFRGASGRASAADFFDRAAQAGLVLHAPAFLGWLRARKDLASGSEHTVYFDRRSQRVIKVTHPDVVGDGAIGQHPDLRSYLRNLDMLNRTFGDDVRLEGVVQLEGEFPQIVTSQPFIKDARQATLAEIEAYMELQGFQKQADGSYYNEALKIRASDLVGPNMLARDTTDGVVIMAIDPQLRFEGDEYSN
jgi:hypothetical protein